MFEVNGGKWTQDSGTSESDRSHPHTQNFGTAGKREHERARVLRYEMGLRHAHTLSITDIYLFKCHVVFITLSLIHKNFCDSQKPTQPSSRPLSPFISLRLHIPRKRRRRGFAGTFLLLLLPFFRRCSAFPHPLSSRSENLPHFRKGCSCATWGVREECKCHS